MDLHGRRFNGRKPAWERRTQLLLQRKRRTVVNHNVLESSDGRLSFGPQRLEAQSLDKPRAHRAHERGKSRAGQAVIERFVGDLHAVLIIEGAEQISERLDVHAGERRDDREKQSMGRDRAQPFGLAGLATELIERIDGQRTRESIPDPGKLSGRQGGQRQPPLLVGVVTPA